MEISSLKEPHHKFNKTLIRYSCRKEFPVYEEYKHPEKSHILKYFPKYYNHLTLLPGNHNPLISRVKRIKKVQKLTVKLDEKTAICRTLLGNHRKNMKELPQIICKYAQVRLKRLALWKIKSFPNITRLFFPRRKTEDSDDFLAIRKSFMRYLRNMRRLRILEIVVKDENSQWMKWMEEKLNGMQKSLGRLNVLGMEICNQSVKIQEVFKHKDLMSQITSLRFSFHMMIFDQSLMIIPETCKKLTFFWMSFKNYSESARNQFESFLTCMKELPNLHSLGVDASLLPFDFFKPKSSEKSKRKWDLPKQLPKKYYSSTRILPMDSKLIKELDEVEFNLKRSYYTDLESSKNWIAEGLKKAQKLRSLKCSIREDFFINPDELISTGLPFSIDSDYRFCESLERFEYTDKSQTFYQLDVKKLMKFSNLRIIKLDGQDIDGESIEEMVNLLQKNQKDGEYSLLQLKLRPKRGSSWFEDRIMRIRNAKDNEKNLKIVLDFSFPMWFERADADDDYYDWELFVYFITEGGAIKGLYALFWLNHSYSNEFELLEVVDGRVRLREGDKDHAIYQDPELYII